MDSGGDLINCLIIIDEILDIINESKMQIGFEITSESCYSGELCHRAKNWFEKNVNYTFKYLIINSSTFRKNRGVWGKYRRFKRAAIVSVEKGITP